MTEKETLNRILWIVVETLIYSPAVSLTQARREELAELIGAYETFQNPPQGKERNDG